jgi:hypothetical protein
MLCITTRHKVEEKAKNNNGVLIRSAVVGIREQAAQILPDGVMDEREVQQKVRMTRYDPCPGGLMGLPQSWRAAAAPGGHNMSKCARHLHTPGHPWTCVCRSRAATDEMGQIEDATLQRIFRTIH